MTPEEYLAEKTVSILYSCQTGVVELVSGADALEAVRMARMEIKAEVERQKQLLFKQIWNESDKDMVCLVAHKLNKINHFIDEKNHLLNK